MEKENNFGHIGFAVKSLGRQINRRIDGMLSDISEGSVTGVQGMIIGFIACHSDEDVFQRDLEAHFNVRRSTVTGVLQLMENNGLIIREPVAHDARLKKLVLTEKAVRLNTAIEENIAELEKSMSQALSKEELANFFDYINRIQSVLSN